MPRTLIDTRIRAGLVAALFTTLVAPLFAGCAPGLRQVRRADLPPRVRVAGVPSLVQEVGHCGPTSLAALLAWAGHPEAPEALAPLVYLPGRSGTLPIDLSREIRARGLLAYRVPTDLAVLLGEIARAHPALVLENRGLAAIPLWHYSVLAGYDLAADAVLLHAGGDRPEEVALATFARTWARGGSFALLALPPGELPGAEDPEGILSALADLEEAGAVTAAARGYEAFLVRWPGDWRGAFGWGNSLYAAGDAEAAERAFRRAHATAPARPEPLNNLALLVAADGRCDEARALADRAVASARDLGRDPGPYRETRSEVCEGEAP